MSPINSSLVKNFAVATTYPKIATNGLILNLDAGQQSSYNGGAIWRDLSGSGNNGSLINGVGYNSANGGFLTFDGVNDYSILARPSSIVTGGQISISLWARWVTTGTTTSTIQALIDNNHSSSPLQGFVIQDRPDLSKSLTFSVVQNSNGAQSTFQVGDGNWHHITGTNDQSNTRLYIDGVLNAQVAQGGLGIVQPNISIGYWQFTPGRYLNGNVSQVSIYNRALSAAEIQQNFNALKGRYGI